jgi:hypothetical protein
MNLHRLQEIEIIKHCVSSCSNRAKILGRSGKFFFWNESQGLCWVFGKRGRRTDEFEEDRVESNDE